MILLMFTKRVFPRLKMRKQGSVSAPAGTSGDVGIAYPVPGAKLVRLVDIAVLVWIAGWLVLALLVGREVRDLRELSDTVVVAGVAVEDTGDLVDSLGSVPLVGGEVGQVADRVREAGRSAQVSGRESRSSIDDLSVLLALAIGLVPTLPLLALYAPLRIAWARDARSVRRAVESRGSDPILLELLARRALLTRPYEQIRAVTSDPFRDLEQGRFGPLADLELRRLGLKPRAASTNGEPGSPRVPTGDAGPRHSPE